MSLPEKPMLLDFSSLELIPKLLEKITNLENEISIIKNHVVLEYDLTTRKGVKQFLGITESSLSKKMKNQELVCGIHYIREINGNKHKITFVELAIKKYKREKRK